jgi:hypothetical protein
MLSWCDVQLMDAFQTVLPALFFVLLIVLGSFFLLNLTIAVMWMEFDEIHRQDAAVTDFRARVEQLSSPQAGKIEVRSDTIRDLKISTRRLSVAVLPPMRVSSTTVQSGYPQRRPSLAGSTTCESVSSCDSAVLAQPAIPRGRIPLAFRAPLFPPVAIDSVAMVEWLDDSSQGTSASQAQRDSSTADSSSSSSIPSSSSAVVPAPTSGVAAPQPRRPSILALVSQPFVSTTLTTGTAGAAARTSLPPVDEDGEVRVGEAVNRVVFAQPVRDAAWSATRAASSVMAAWEQRWRPELQRVCNTAYFNGFTVVLILLNTAVLSADHHPMNSTVAFTLDTANFCLTLCFACEMALKVAAFGVREHFGCVALRECLGMHAWGGPCSL